jgi:hypothetical protein
MLFPHDENFIEKQDLTILKFSANLGDLHMFDPVELEWTEIGKADASLPPSRDLFGFSGAGGALFVFGGTGVNTGESCNKNLL